MNPVRVFCVFRGQVLSDTDRLDSLPDGSRSDVAAAARTPAGERPSIFEAFINNGRYSRNTAAVVSDAHADSIVEAGDDLDLGFADRDERERAFDVLRSLLDREIRGFANVLVMDRSIGITAGDVVLGGDS